MPPTPEDAPDAPAEGSDLAVARKGLPWPVWALGLIGAIAAILWVFVVLAR